MDGFGGAQRLLGLLAALTGLCLLIAASVGAFDTAISLMIVSIIGVTLMTIGGIAVAKSYLDL